MNAFLDRFGTPPAGFFQRHIIVAHASDSAPIRRFKQCRLEGVESPLT
jgi:hypothetical protein